MMDKKYHEELSKSRQLNLAGLTAH